MADQIRATPRNPFFGLFSDLVNAPLSYMSDPRRTQQMQGVASFLRSTGVPYTLENLSYDPSGRGLFTGAGGLGGTTRLRPEVAEAALTVAPFGGPAAKVGVRGAMATGRALGPTAAGMAERYMQRQGMMPSLNVFHGSPYKFDKFDSSKIGTGEGNQTYGYGLYLAEAKPVAEDYAFGFINKKMASQLKSLSESDDVVDKAAAARLFYNDDSDALTRFIKNKNPNLGRAEVDKVLNASSKKFKSIKEKYGYVYDVDLPDEQIAKMIDWDKPMSEAEMIRIYDLMQQSPLSNFAKAFQDNYYSRMERRAPLTDGQDLFMELSKELGGQKQVSDALRDIGIPGIRYLDQGSRGAGKGTSNFVVFPGMEDTLRIMRRNEEAVNPMFADPFANTIDDTTR
jgi:hypothetical protein